MVFMKNQNVYSANRYTDIFIQQFIDFIVPQGKTYCIISPFSTHTLKFRKKYDYIIAVTVLEKEKDIIAFLQNIYEHLFAGGRLIIIYKNYLYPYLGGRSGNNWLSHADILTFLKLVGLEPIYDEPLCFLNYNIPIISEVANRLLLYFFPFNHLSTLRYILAVKEDVVRDYSVSIIIPARNEEGTIKKIFAELPTLGTSTEVIFVEGHSSDNTREEIRRHIATYQHKNNLRVRLLLQENKGKADAVHLGIKNATGEIVILYDADMTVLPSDLPKFYEALRGGRGDFINGSRLIYPIEEGAMQTLNIFGNKLFSLFFTFVFGQSIKDTLCGTKAFFRRDYLLLEKQQMDFLIKKDPFGDFYLLYGAKRLSLRILDLPVRYYARSYGATNISRFTNAWELLKFSLYSFKKLKMRL